MKESQRKWNERIRSAGKDATMFSETTMSQLIDEGGPLWNYEGPPYNTDAYRDGWERTFGQGKNSDKD